MIRSVLISQRIDGKLRLSRKAMRSNSNNVLAIQKSASAVWIMTKFAVTRRMISKISNNMVLFLKQIFLFILLLQVS
ncbi:hypothetical protein BVJ53_04480 [Lacticaseibacillus chiayiensis]|uniref:Uncharacterized protein n=1 Tax=Lacticaseibacillus chiayiensis TaxID=2100821 RepID=A0A4Q1U6D9_9LACO|nr:hypothetical protein BVJ53_04480 [Lacticaseibacillus chiayiensis]